MTLTSVAAGVLTCGNTDKKESVLYVQNALLHTLRGLRAVVNWIMENGYEIAGAPFDLYIKTQFDSLSPEDWETEVYFPIKKR